MVVFLNDLEAHAEGALVFIPVGAEHLETTDLRGAADMLADTGTDVVVADTHQADGVGGIVGQAGLIDLLRQLVAGDKLERHGQICFDELVHATLYLFFFLATGLLIEMETHLAFLPLDMGIVRALTAEDPLHGLIQQMLCGVSWGKFFLVMVIEYIIGHFLKFLAQKYKFNLKKTNVLQLFGGLVRQTDKE